MRKYEVQNTARTFTQSSLEPFSADARKICVVVICHTRCRVETWIRKTGIH